MSITAQTIDFVFYLIAAEFVVITVFLVRAQLVSLIGPLFFFLASGALLFLCLKIALMAGVAPASPDPVPGGIPMLGVAGGAAFATHLAAIVLAARAITRMRQDAGAQASSGLDDAR